MTTDYQIGGGHKLTFLTSEEREVFEEDYSIKVGRYYHKDGWLSIGVDINAEPLKKLAESATFGHRVYELMTISRPGDIQNYLQLKIIDIHHDLQQEVNRAWHVWNERDQDTKVLPYKVFDGLFYWDCEYSHAPSACWKSVV